MSFWQRLFGGGAGAAKEQTGPIVRVVLHLDTFNDKGVDHISILERPVAAATKVPFTTGPTRESIEPYDPKRHFTMDGRVPDTVHRFVRPNGVPLDFLIKDGIIIQCNDNVAGYRR